MLFRFGEFSIMKHVVGAWQSVCWHFEPGIDGIKRGEESVREAQEDTWWTACLLARIR